MKRAIVFPGQGSQHRGMGAAVLAQYPALVAEADAILGYSIRDVCLNAPGADLDKTEITQPAVYVVSMLEYQRMMETGSVAPHVVAGHSLGEYAALAAAGVFSFATGLSIVERRGALMGAAYGGGLVAIIGADIGAVEKLLQEDGIAGVEIANINSPEQVVVGGRKDKLQGLLAACTARSLRAVPLRVSGAFHTSHMAEAAQQFSAFLADIEFAPPRMPVVANVDGHFHHVDNIRDRLVEQMVKPVRWLECVETMLEAGVTEFVEVGPTRVLTPLIASISRAWTRSQSSEAPQPKDEAKPASIAPSQSSFCERFDCGRPLVVGSLGHGMAGARLVKALASASVLSFLDTDGLELEAVDEALDELMADASTRQRIGVSLRADLDAPQRDEALVDCLFRHNVRCIEVRGYVEPTEPLKRYREARNGDHCTRIIARVGTREAAAAFLLGALPLQRNVMALPEADKAPWADALCIDLDCWRSRRGASIDLLSSALEWRAAYRRSNGALPFFVGVSGLMVAPSTLNVCLPHIDFTMVGSVYLLTREAQLDEKAKAYLLSDEVRFQAWPDWQVPELETRTWSAVSDRKLCDVAEKLHKIYLQGAAQAGLLRELAADLAEPFRSRLQNLAKAISECADTYAVRATLRREAKALLFPGIIECDGSLSHMRAETRRAIASGMTAAQLTDLLYPLTDHEETQHG